MKKEWFSIFILVLLLHSCRTAEINTLSNESISTENGSPPATFEVSPETSTPTTENQSPEFTPEPCDLSHAGFLFVDDGKLYKFEGCEKTMIPVDLGAAGEIYDTALLDRRLYIISDLGFFQADLSSADFIEIKEFSAPVLYCRLAVITGLERIAFSCSFDDPEAEFNIGTRVGIYNVAEEILQELPFFHRGTRFIGSSQDTEEIYTLSLGQDPEFREITRINLATQQVVGTINVEGNNLAEISPDHRYLATTNFLYENDSTKPIINLYDLTKPDDPLTESSVLPVPLDYVENFVWGNAGELVLLLKEGDPWNSDPDIAKVWEYSNETGEWQPSVEITGQGASIVSIDPSGRWLLIHFYSKDEARLVDLENMRVYRIDYPSSAEFTGWVSK